MDIKGFQNQIRETFFEKDSARGIDGTFVWFVEEVGELARAIKKGGREELIEEFSDVAAWLFSLANLLDVDMESALVRYADGCPKCGGKICECKGGHECS